MAIRNGKAPAIIGAAAVTTLVAGGAMAATTTVRVGDATWHRAEWRASTFAPSTQAQTSLAVGADGTIVTTWSSRRQQSGRYGVYAQRFDGSGRAVGTETTVNVWTESHQWCPVVAAGGGASWIVWQSHGQDGEAGSIIARRIDAGDAWPGGSEILVNETWRGHQADPVAAVSPGGALLVAWTVPGAGGAADRVRARIFDAAGQPRGPEFGVCSDGLHQRTPAVTWTSGGGFAIAYAVAGDTPVETAILLQRFDRDGAPAGLPRDVRGTVRASQIEPVIAAQGDHLVVAWLDAQSDGHDYGVLARRFDADGAPVGPAIVVNTTVLGTQNAAAVAVAADGRYAIAWNGEDGDERGIFAQLFGADGARSGGEFRVSGRSGGRQAMREATGTSRLAFTPDGGLVCAWHGDAGLGDDSAAHVTLLSPRPLGDEVVRGVTPAMAAAVLETETAAQPYLPPTFDPADIVPDDGEREVVTGAGGTGFLGVTNSGWTPPDPHLAAGPNHVVVMTNGEIAFFAKDGTRTFVDEIENSFGFWGSLGADNFVFDPEVVFDPHSQRFMAMACERSDDSRSFFLLAVSDDDDPNGSWFKYRLDVTALAGNDIDSPNIGVDADTVYLTSDHFGPSNYLIVMLRKSDLLVGAAPLMRDLLVVGDHSFGIPVNYDADAPAQYMIQGLEFGTYTSLVLHAITDPLGSPSRVTTNLTVPAYAHPEDPPQMGTSSRPEMFEARFWSCVYRNGSLWATHHTGDARVLARWYEIAMNGWPTSGDQPALVQSGDIDPGGSTRTFFGSIAVDDAGNAAMTYARSSPTEFISMETAMRYASDPPGTFNAGVQRAVNTGPYTFGRWGDYSAIAVDPADGKTFWAHHEYAVGSSWRTWIHGFTPFFNIADLTCDGRVDFADLLVLFGDWGPCSGCPADLNGDGVVSFADVLIVFQNWG